MFDCFQLFSKIGPVFGPSGLENGIRALLRELAAPYADEITEDTLGNLIVHKRGPGKKIMACAHMDSIGFVATYIDDNGFVRFAPVGGHTPTGVMGARVVFKNGVRGVIGFEEKVKPEDLALSDFFIDLGVSGADEARALVGPGDFAVFCGDAYQNGTTMVGPYLDNRAGCVALLHALSLIEEPACDLYFVFTVQEEVGLRGALTAAYQIAPDVGLAVDVTDSDDVPGLKEHCSARMGKGPAVKMMDQSVVAATETVQLLKDAAGRLGIAVQPDIIRVGGTDAGSIQKARGGVLAGGLSIPCRYIHTPSEMVSLSDVEQTSEVLAELMRSSL